MKNTQVSTFSFKNLSDAQIEAMFNELQTERAERAERARKRAEWISRMMREYLANPNATYKVLGNTTIVALYFRATGVSIGTTTVRGNDTYDERVGIAVAYAKAVGERIPYYI